MFGSEEVEAYSKEERETGFTRYEQEQYNKHLEKLHQDFVNAWNDDSDIRIAKLSDFERYQILGTGTFGVVYLVKQIATGNFYAMKRLEKQRIIRLKQIDHTYYEKKILCGLNFKFVIRMEFFFKDNVYLNLVLPFINGGEMFKHLRKSHKFTEATAKFYGGQVILAFEYLHTCELVYRDLKPENILIDNTGYIKITDFGFCKYIRDRTWTLCGTPEYLAPEIILMKGYGKTVDWWSLGVLLFEMTAGQPPFTAADPMKIYEKIVVGSYTCPSHFSKELKDLLKHVLEVDITRRYGNLRSGVLDFKNHKWFKAIIWDSLLNGRLPAPFIPEVSSPGDARYFDVINVTDLDKVSPDCLYEQEFAEF